MTDDYLSFFFVFAQLYGAFASQMYHDFWCRSFVCTYNFYESPWLLCFSVSLGQRALVEYIAKYLSIIINEQTVRT